MAGSAIDALREPWEPDATRRRRARRATCRWRRIGLEGARSKLLLSGASRWYTASEMELGSSECSVAVKRNPTADKAALCVRRRGCPAFNRSRKAPGSSTCPGGIGMEKGPQQSVRCGRVDWVQACRALHGRTRRSKGVEGAQRALRRHKKATGSRRPGQARYYLQWTRNGGAQHKTAKSGCKSLRLVISKGPGRAN
jgi:hypothetical protein